MKNRKQTRFSALLTIAILIGLVFLFLLASKKGITAKAGETALEVRAPFFSETVPYNEVENIEMQSSITYGKRVFGSDFIIVKTGTFRNAAFGEYRCAVLSGQKKAVVLKKTDGSYLVFNMKSEEDLSAVVKEVKSKTDSAS